MTPDPTRTERHLAADNAASDELADLLRKHHATNPNVDRWLADLASLRAQLVAANDSIARVRALCDEWERDEVNTWTQRLRAALTPEAPR